MVYFANYCRCRLIAYVLKVWSLAGQCKSKPKQYAMHKKETVYIAYTPPCFLFKYCSTWSTPRLLELLIYYMVEGVHTPLICWRVAKSWGHLTYLKVIDCMSQQIKQVDRNITSGSQVYAEVSPVLRRSLHKRLPMLHAPSPKKATSKRNLLNWKPETWMAIISLPILDFISKCTELRFNTP